MGIMLRSHFFKNQIIFSCQHYKFNLQRFFILLSLSFKKFKEFSRVWCKQIEVFSSLCLCFCFTFLENTPYSNKTQFCQKLICFLLHLPLLLRKLTVFIFYFFLCFKSPLPLNFVWCFCKKNWPINCHSLHCRWSIKFSFSYY